MNRFKIGDIVETEDKLFRGFITEKYGETYIVENKRGAAIEINSWSIDFALTKWDKKYIELLKSISSWSKDTTKVSCVIVNKNQSVVSMGYNGPARKVHDLKERFERPAKYKFCCHSEAAAIGNAAFNGVSTEDCTAYINLHPCAQCMSLLLNSGISRVVCPQPDWTKENWKEDFEASQAMMNDSQMNVLYYE